MIKTNNAEVKVTSIRSKKVLGEEICKLQAEIKKLQSLQAEYLNRYDKLFENKSYESDNGHRVYYSANDKNLLKEGELENLVKKFQSEGKLDDYVSLKITPFRKDNPQLFKTVFETVKGTPKIKVK